MKREQAIKHLEVMKGDYALVGDIRALDMAISALSENRSKWIPVSERLPEKNVWVLVTVDNRYLELMRRNFYTEDWTDGFDIYTDEITAWMPLPEPYKAESEETE